MRKIKVIDSILQVTKNVVQRNDKYYGYIINENNSFYKKQLPLITKNKRVNSLVLLKQKNNEKEIQYQSTKNSSQKENIKNELNIELEQSSSLNNIRTIKTRPKKLPALCPIFNSKGVLLHSIVSSRRDICLKSINNADYNLYNLSNSVNKQRNNIKIFGNQKIRIKKISYNKSFINLDLNYKKFKLTNLNEPGYDNLIYDESEIFGKSNIYQEIIRNKLIELQTIYNKNYTIKKEKVFKYGLHKKNIILTLDSLKIRLNEVKDEHSYKIEVYENPSFEYTFPFALLPLYYYKDVETFLMILTKLLIWDEEAQRFSFTKKDDEIISNILKNCDDFYVDDNDKSYMEEVTDNDSFYMDMSSEKNLTSRSKINFNNALNDFNKNSSTSLTNTINFLKSSNKSLNIYDFKNDNKSYDIYPKLMKREHLNFATFEYFWLTPKKCFILTIETPLITINIPSSQNMAKKYIDFELLFFLFSKNFIMWDFYIIHNLLTFRNFRNLLDNLYSIPEKRNIFFYIIQPKHWKNLFTFYELTSLITREGRKKKVQKKNISGKENYKERKEKFNRTYKENKKLIQELYYKVEEQKIVENEENNNQINNNNKNNDIYYFNSSFIQKGLLVIATFIEKENEIFNEYTFHFNLDQLRKFQIMEMFIDKISFFIKFLKIDYENKVISFDFDSFNEFQEFNWIKDFSKYNFSYSNLLLKKNQELKSKDFIPKMIQEFEGMKKGTKIRVEIKCPLILMKALDNNGFITTETVNVDYRVEQILSKIIIHNSIDLTRQLVNILKDNNFCRKIYVSKRALNKKNGTKRKKHTNRIKELPINQIINNSPRLSFCSLGVVPDTNED